MSAEIDNLHVALRESVQRVEALEAENKRLLEALREAVEWNWMDEDVPLGVVNKVADALSEGGEQVYAWFHEAHPPSP